MYEETKELLTNELKAIVKRDGMAAAIKMVEHKSTTATGEIIALARYTLEQYPRHRNAKRLQTATEKLATLRDEYSDQLKAIARNEHGELRDGAWIDFGTPYNPKTSKTPQEVKDVYEKAYQLAFLLEQQGFEVLDIVAGINPDAPDPSDPSTFDPACTYNHPDEYPDELTDEEVEQIRDYFAQAGFQVSRTAIWWQFCGWKVGAKSGYRDAENGCHLFTPVNYNPFRIDLTRLTPSNSEWQTTYHY